MKSLELKIPPAIVFGLIALGMWWIASLDTGHFVDPELGRVLFWILFGIGTLFGIAGLISFYRARTSIDPHKPEKVSSLVTSGIYRLSRNPMYVGLAIILGAWAIRLGSLLSMIGVVLFVLYITRFQIIPEERVMNEKFGEEFEEYRSRVRRWL
ncbi:methyltransferase family protein [Rhodohalobacter mucosus]|uniref:Protein-S-isoprenylcysteine methyltransferase n=1 Tax=Rhodohalobacter mucosus TaxID=2079485 RepID=A0A316TQ21_9BACT|nr:isoprenylcysteine carboxylmethyltransferase family protein [Rhodohalobacter mucosus]PWN06723.1 protein-S-isoprenylcysteine methyltransferase [Rhodohalobacter mucosus]